MKIKKILGATLVCVTLMSTVVLAFDTSDKSYGIMAYLNVDGHSGLHKVSTGTIRKDGTTQSSLTVYKTYYDGSENTINSGMKLGDTVYASGYEYIEDYHTHHETTKNANTTYTLDLYY